MAIGEGGEKNPYVHSDINHWSTGGYDISPALIERRDVDYSINALRQIRRQLEAEANEFLMGASVDYLNKNIDNNPQTYSDVAINLIQSTAARDALMKQDTQITKEDVEKLLTEIPEKIKNKVIDELDMDEIATVGAREFGRALGRAASNADGTLTPHGCVLNKKLLEAAGYEGVLNPNNTNKVLKEITGVAVNQLKKASPRFVDAVEAIINKELLKGVDKDTADSVTGFMAWFRQKFLEKLDEIKFVDVDKTPEKFLDDVEGELRKRITGIIKDERNAVGTLGDEVIVSIWQADPRTAALGLSFESIGKLSEEEASKKFKELKTMITHHRLDKSSQTDIVIKNKNGKMIRVQAKNSLLNRKFTFENQKMELLLAHVQRSMDLITLLNNLGIPNVEQISYTIVNALWFSAHESVTGKRVSGKLQKSKNGNKDAGILSNLRSELDALFSTQATNFLGITLDKASEDMTQIIGEASNIFFLKGGKFIPTYILVDQVIEDLENYAKGEARFRGLHFVIENSGKVSWKYNNATNFWKYKAADDFKNRVEYATSQGAAAISSLSVNGKFNAIKEYTSLEITTNA